jgi:2C-methyl-D-erythritol 2,4-cyclodiphosphate synthase
MRRRCRYHVVAERSAQGWSLVAVGVRGALSHARRLTDAERSIRSAIASVLGVPEESFDVEVDVRGRLSRPRPTMPRNRPRLLTRLRWTTSKS